MMNNLMNMKNNLIQNFYVIGLSIENIFKDKKIFTSNKEVELIPKIISKFPPNDYNHNAIPNEIVVEHCFPNGFKMIKSQNNEPNNNTYFYFEIDNLQYSYLSKNKSLYSKIYFTCLKFNESLQDYQKLRLEIDNNKLNNESQSNNIILDNNNISNNEKNFYIPKVICFATLLPFTKELNKILNNIYNYYFNYNNNNDITLSSMNNSISPLEKILEQFVMCLPFPLFLYKEYCISFNYNNSNNSTNSTSTVNSSNNSINTLKNNLVSSSSFGTNANQIGLNNISKNNSNIIFPKYEPLICFMNDIYSTSLIYIFLFFNEEEIIKIFKYIILEIPILFFSEDIELLSKIIQGFLSLLQPFSYVLPYVTVLPKKFYGLINMETSFIFGIAEKYSSEFFKNNNILLDKNIIIINCLEEKKSKIEEAKKIEDQKDYVIIDNYNIYNYINNESFLPNNIKIDKINIDFPRKPKIELINGIKACLSEIKKKKNNEIDYGREFNQKIRCLFYFFFTDILSGYYNYFLKINNYNINSKANTGYYYGDNIRYKINYNSSNLNSINNYNNEVLFIKSIFNIDEFISKYHKDSHIFHRAFCNTKLFQFFIRENFFSKDEHILLNHKYFEIMTYFKKHEKKLKDLKKNEKYKELLLYENLFDKKINKNKREEKVEPKIIFNISNDSNYNSYEKGILSIKEKQNEALLSYSQFINISNISNQNLIYKNNLREQTIIKYFIFPKILYDNEFFNLNYDKLFFRHFLEIPDFSVVKQLNLKLEQLNNHYLDFHKELIPKYQNEPINSIKMAIDYGRNSNFDISGNNNINSIQDMEVLISNYIEYNWLLLISCSLWYCSNLVETEIRINKIFEILEKIDLIEEQVLLFLYLAIYKFGSKTQFIKMFEYLNRFMGYSSYINLIYLCLKITKKEINSDNNIKDKINFKKRCFFYINELKTSIKKLNSNEIIEKENIDNKIVENDSLNNNINLREEIIFYTNQICQKCKNKNEIQIEDLIHHRISQKRDNFLYKCNNCQEENNIFINYNISLKEKKNETKICGQGKFKLIPPHIIYREMKEKFIYLQDKKLDLDHIFSNNNIYLLNNIFYFSKKELNFDFLIPYEGQDDREYFEVEEDEKNNINNDEDLINENNNSNENKKFPIYTINSENFSLSRNE